MLYQIRGIITFLLYLCFTTAIVTVFFFLAVLKFIVPLQASRALFGRSLDILSSTAWVFCANLTHRITGNFQWIVNGDTAIKTKQWSAVISNHQSWVDILVLIKVFYRKVPPYKFFIKKELLWVPLMGPCFWALDFPVMRRYSREFLEKNPHLKGKDLEATRKACEKYKKMPVTIINFPEGTRFTPEKHKKKHSPYQHLLPPKAGGTSLIFFAMGDLLKHIFDVTITYPGGTPGLWDFFCGRPRRIIVDIKQMKMQQNLSGNYFTDTKYKKQFQEWLNRFWEEKDTLLDRRKKEHLAG